MSLPNTIIIPHGSTEVKLAEWLRSELRTQAIIYRPYGREERTVSMRGVRDILMAPPFDQPKSIHRRFDELEYGRMGFRDLAIAPVLDVDADRRSLGAYKSGDMFRGFCLGKEAVLPVFNDPNLEAVIERAGYGRVAHDLGEFQEFLDSTDVDEFRERMGSCDSTNMEVLIDRLCRHVPRYQHRCGPDAGDPRAVIGCRGTGSWSGTRARWTRTCPASCTCPRRPARL